MEAGAGRHEGEAALCAQNWDPHHPQRLAAQGWPHDGGRERIGMRVCGGAGLFAGGCIGGGGMHLIMAFRCVRYCHMGRG